jgi:uncharacterized protein YyaL (SSP411 family)
MAIWSAPKFPHPAVLDLPWIDARAGTRKCAKSSFHAGEMARGGSMTNWRRVSPLLGGRALIVPHFEKMCYDNLSC